MHFRYPPYGTSAENPGTLDLVRYHIQPTMVAGELSVEISEGETSGEDFRDGDHSDIDD